MVVTLVSVNCIFKAFIGEGGLVVERSFKAFVGEGAVTSIEGAVIFIGGAVMSIGKGGLAVRRSFETARVGVDDVKGVNKCNLRQWLIIYKLKVPLLSIYS